MNRVERHSDIPSLKGVINPSFNIDTLCSIGVSHKGPAFVPTQIALHEEDDNVKNTFENIFGLQEFNKFKNLRDEYSCSVDSQGYESSRVWFENGGLQFSFTRVLGLGTGVKNAEGVYEGSGFNLSEPIYRNSVLNNSVYENPNSVSGGIEGSVSFIIKDMENISTTNLDPFKNYLNELSISGTSSKFITDVIMCPQGVFPTLHSKDSNNDLTINFNHFDPQPVLIEEANSQLSTKQATFNFSSSGLLGYPFSYQSNVNTPTFSTNFYILLNGLSNVSNANNVIQITEFDILRSQSNKEFKESLSKNYYSSRIQEKGHKFYCSFNTNRTLNLKNPTSNQNNVSIFTALKKQTVESAAGDNIVPDYNEFRDKYQVAKTPWIVSQPYNRNDLQTNRVNISKNVYRLFRFYSLDDGEIGNRFRIKIAPKQIGDIYEKRFSRFDVFIFEYNLIDNTYSLLETYRDLNLNPDDMNYIGRRIGTKKTYYDISSKKVITTGLFENVSKNVRVELSEDVINKKLEVTYIPSGFEGYPHIEFNKNAFKSYQVNDVTELDDSTKFDNYFSNINQLPLTYNPNYSIDKSLPEDIEYINSWGSLFYNIKSKEEIYKNIILYNQNTSSNSTYLYKQNIYEFRDSNENDKHFSPHYFYTKYFQSNKTSPSKNVWVEESNWLNSFFHLEKIAYPQKSNSLVLTNLLEKSIYIRSGKTIDSSLHSTAYTAYKYLNIDEVLDSNKNSRYSIDSFKLTFDVFTCGGFDGTNILDKDKKFLNNNAITRENNRESNSVTKESYKHAIDLATEFSNCLGDIFIIPGIRDKEISKKIIRISNEEERFIYLTDIQNVVTTEEISGDFFVTNDEVNINREDTIIKNISNGKVVYREKVINNYDLYYRNFNLYDYSSKYFVPLLGEIIDNERKFIHCPTVYISGLMSQTISDPINSIDFQYNLGNELIDNENFKYSEEFFEDRLKTLKENGLNIIIDDNSEGLRLYTSNTTFGIRSSEYRQLESVRAINHVKKVLESELILNRNGILFDLNSSTSNSYVVAENKIRSIMENLKSQNIIEDFQVSVPNPSITGVNEDLLNNILKTKLYIQLKSSRNETNPIQLFTLNELSKEIKSLTNLAEDIKLLSV